MQLEVVNNENQRVGSVDINDELFGGRINGDLMWESVVHANAADRQGTHAAKTRAFVSGTGKKPWKQKGTGRAQVGSSRTPLWRHGGTTHPPRPRSYDFKLSKKVELGALRAAPAGKLQAGGGARRPHRPRRGRAATTSSCPRRSSSARCARRSPRSCRRARCSSSRR